jgi:lipopolysaccharide exporter
VGAYPGRYLISTSNPDAVVSFWGCPQVRSMPGFYHDASRKDMSYNSFMSPLKKAIYGVSWVGLLRGSTRGIAFIKIFILARILTPDQFGVFGIATLVLALLEIFTETGVNVFFVQKEGKLKDYIDTAWVVSIGRGILISIILVILSPFISTFFNSPSSLQLLLLISLVPFIKGFINPAESLFQSEMNFKKEFWFRFILFSFDACVAIIFAIYTKDPSSLIYGLIAGAALEVILSFIMITPRPKLAFDQMKAKHIINRGKWSSGFGIFEYIFRNGDDIVVGKILGESSLGIYQMAYKLAILPITEVADVLGKVTFPLFVDISHDKVKLKKALINTTLSVCILLVPILLVILFVPEFIIHIALGDQWISAAGVLQVLVIYAMIRALVNPALTVILAMKKQEYLTIISFIGTATLFVSIFPLLSIYGIIGVGISTVIASLVTIPLIWFYTKKLLK